MLDQNTTPLLKTLKILSESNHAPFYAPGHKKGQGVSATLKNLLGASVFQADLPELPALDNLFQPAGVIKEAQDLAAEAFGADQTWFLINGSTAGIIASILAVCQPGEQIILPRNIHQSVISGLILSGAVPVYIQPPYNSDWDIVLGITPASVETALQKYPEAKAVFLVYPTYQGICADIRAIAQITHQYNIPLIVDEAHGPHFTFHADLPMSALEAGADLAVQSTHKVLGAMTQASMLHMQGDRIAPQRISQALQMLQSTSPSYLLLASLDAARQQMFLEGEALLTKTLQLAEQARHSISQIAGLAVFASDDPTRLTVKVADLGISGYEADAIFNEQLGVVAELPSLQNLTFIISIGNTDDDITKLIQAFKVLAKQAKNRNIRTQAKNTKQFSDITNSVNEISIPSTTPREAFFSKSVIIPITEAVGKISADLICPYPPGIPCLIPGEKITQSAIDYLQIVLELGGTITGCRDNLPEQDQQYLRSIAVLNNL
ncbi:MAG: aminotransferase class I/II-fold pyridoxal phosphate-dependent enzyme [Microcoleaceae cyanobacterium]